MECRCIVCGARLGDKVMFSKSPRVSEVCSDECAEIYFHVDLPLNSEELAEIIENDYSSVMHGKNEVRR